MVRECAARGCWQTFTLRAQQPNRRYCSRRCGQRARRHAQRLAEQDPTVTALNQAVTVALARSTTPEDRAAARETLGQLAGPYRRVHRQKVITTFGQFITAALEHRIDGH